MTEPPLSDDDLIRRYLDRAATPAELAELEQRLARPDFAAAFAGACRLEAWLRVVVKEEARVAQTQARCVAVDGRQRRRSRARRGVAAAVSILIICFGLWRMLPSRPPSAVRDSSSAMAAQQTPSLHSPFLGTSQAVLQDPTRLAAAVAMLGLVTANTVR
jgi:hypothetical protein